MRYAPPRPQLDDVHSSMREYHSLLERIIRQAWDQWLAWAPLAPTALKARSRANVVHDLIIACADQEIGQRAEVITTDHNQLILYRLGSAAIIRFKKLNDEGLGCNIRTQQQFDYMSQTVIDGVVEIPRLVVGYMLDPSGLAIEDIRVALQTDFDVVEWSYSIADAARGLGTVIPFEPRPTGDGEIHGKSRAGPRTDRATTNEDDVAPKEGERGNE